MSDATTDAERPEVAWGWRHLWSVAGVTLLLAWLPFYAFISLIAPGWTVVPALAVWALLLLLAVRWFRPHPARTLVVGVVAIGLWHLAASLFDTALGWTA